MNMLISEAPGVASALIDPDEGTITIEPLKTATLESDLEKLSSGTCTFVPVNIRMDGENLRPGIRVYSHQWYMHDPNNPGLALIISKMSGKLQIEMFVPLDGHNNWEKVSEEIMNQKIDEYDLATPLDIFFTMINMLS